MRHIYANRIKVTASIALTSLCFTGFALVACDGEYRDYNTATERARGVAGSAGSSAATEGMPRPAPGDARTAQSSEGTEDVGGEGENDATSFQPMSESSGTQSAAESAAESATARCIEGATESCGPPSEEGVCKFGVRTCAAGSWGECVGAVLPASRNCASAEDNDCDGQPDDGIDDVCRCPTAGTRACEAHPGLDGKGQCVAGQQQCVIAPDGLSSDWGPCSGSVGPAAADSCSVMGNDADCDGIPNGDCDCIEGTSVPCGPATDLGLCQRGTSTCLNGAFGACQGAVFPAARDCSSAQDNDCDGLPDNTVDATCACAIGTTQACGAHPGRDGNGTCRAGTQQCQAGAGNTSSRFGACTGSVGPAQRDSCTVQGDDADCDGTRNGGCQCIAGAGNLPCAADANNSRCSAQGTCVPCQANADCSLVSQGRSQCSAGRCVAAEPATSLTRFAWNSRLAPVVMASSQSNVCFLTRVGGIFNAVGDSVQIVQQGGQWVLTGSAAAGGFVEARAACAQGQATPEVSLVAGQTGIDLQPFDTHACYLTRITGPFQGGSENVQLQRERGIWRFAATTGQTGTSAAARCFPVQPLSATEVMDFGDASPVALDPEINGACFLLRVAGDLGAEGDFVDTEWNGTRWDLRRQVTGGRSLQTRAVCFGKSNGQVPGL